MDVMQMATHSTHPTIGDEKMNTKRAPYTYYLAGKVPADHHLLTVIDTKTGKPVADVAELDCTKGTCTMTDGKTVEGMFALVYSDGPEKATESDQSPSTVGTSTPKEGGRSKPHGPRA